MRALVRHPLFRILALATWLYVVLLAQVGFVYWLANAIAFLVLLTPGLRNIWIESLLTLLLPLLFYISPDLNLSALPTLLYFLILVLILRSRGEIKPSPPVQPKPRVVNAPVANQYQKKTTQKKNLPSPPPEASWLDSYPNPLVTPVAPRQRSRRLPPMSSRSLRYAFAFFCVAIGMTLTIQRPFINMVSFGYELPTYHSYFQAAELPDRELRDSLIRQANIESGRYATITPLLKLLTFQLPSFELKIERNTKGVPDTKPVWNQLHRLLAIRYGYWRTAYPDPLYTPSSPAERAAYEAALRSAYFDLLTNKYRALQEEFFSPDAAKTESTELVF